MHEAAFRAAGLEGWSYELVDVPSHDLGPAVGRLRDDGFAGANVTIPHKVAVMEHLDAVEGDAVAAGAVNTIRRHGGSLHGLNTDVGGIKAALAEVEVMPRGARVTVLGAGGSARAAAVALGGADLTFVTRNPQRAAGLRGRLVAWADLSWQILSRSADLLLN